VVAAEWAPPPRLKVSEWAEQRRMLSRESADAAGPYRVSAAPYQREMQDAFNDPNVRELVFMTSGQIGKTTMVENIMGYCMDLAPAPMLGVLPTLNLADTFSKDRLAPMIRDTPALRAKVKDAKSRDSSNTLKHKKFPGGQITLIGGNAPSDMASRPIKYAFIDERDRLAEAAGKEGDPYFLIIQRQENYYGAKMVQDSTPTIKDASPIESAFLESDQRYFHIPCKSCGGYQKLVWANVTWEVKKPQVPEDVWYTCAHCGDKWSDGDIVVGLKTGNWIAEAPFNGIAGFHINAIYSPWAPMQRMVSKFLRAKKDTESLKAWVNTQLGETWEEPGDVVEPSTLFARREQYAAEMPAGALVAVAGIDVQGDRLEVGVYGYGIGEESWDITYRVLWGDPDKDDVWQLLDDVLIRGRFKHESGATIGIAASCIDSGGHHTHRVYEYCRTRQSKRIFAIKGMAGFGRPMVSAPSSKRHGRNRRPVKLFTLGVDEIKSHVHSRLGVETPGPGYAHFPLNHEYDEEHFSQLAAEKVVTRMVKGTPKREWIRIRPRNEALDNRGYGYAALCLLNPDFEALAERLRPASAADDSVSATDDAAPDRAPARRRARKSGNYLNKYRRRQR